MPVLKHEDIPDNMCHAPRVDGISLVLYNPGGGAKGQAAINPAGMVHANVVLWWKPNPSLPGRLLDTAVSSASLGVLVGASPGKVIANRVLVADSNRDISDGVTWVSGGTPLAVTYANNLGNPATRMNSFSAVQILTTAALHSAGTFRVDGNALMQNTSVNDLYVNGRAKTDIILDSVPASPNTTRGIMAALPSPIGSIQSLIRAYAGTSPNRFQTMVGNYQGETVLLGSPSLGNPKFSNNIATYQIWNSQVGVGMSHGSGLDADMLDGYHASAFMLYDPWHEFALNSSMVTNNAGSATVNSGRIRWKFVGTKTVLLDCVLDYNMPTSVGTLSINIGSIGNADRDYIGNGFFRNNNYPSYGISSFTGNIGFCGIVAQSQSGSHYLSVFDPIYRNMYGGGPSCTFRFQMFLGIN